MLFLADYTLLLMACSQLRVFHSEKKPEVYLKGGSNEEISQNEIDSGANPVPDFIILKK